jgi:hypothetical protein
LNRCFENSLCARHRGTTELIISSLITRTEMVITSLIHSPLNQLTRSLANKILLHAFVVQVSDCVCVYVYTHIYMCTYTHTHIYICVCVCVCVHTYTQYIYIYSDKILSQRTRYPLTWHTRQLNFSTISSDSQASITSESECHYPTQVAVSRKTTGPTNHGGGAEHCVLYRKPFI